MTTGWIKLHRCLLDKPIWSCSSTEQRVILITILMLANRTEKQWEWKGKKFICRAGQFITSSTKLASIAGVTRQNVRTALKRFRDYEFLTYESTKTGLLITIVNWDKYQSKDTETNQPANQILTNNQPTANQQLTTNKNDKNDKNDKNKDYKDRPRFKPEHMELAERLKKRILEHKPDARLPTVLNNWANTIRLMIERDKRKPERIAEIIDWCQQDTFWQSNILSADKLRAQFDKLELQKERRQPVRQNNIPRAFASLKEWAEGDTS